MPAPVSRPLSLPEALIAVRESEHLLRLNELAANISRSAFGSCAVIPRATWDPFPAVDCLCDPEFLQALL